MIEFYKLSGSGNDFIFIDNMDRNLQVGDLASFAKTVCARQVSVGADGLIVIEPSAKVDFRWRFFNADGSEAAMCGNGGRCAARFAFLKGIAGPRMSFETIAGVIDAEIKDDVAKIHMTAPHSLALDDQIRVGGRDIAVHSVDTGVPHAIHFIEDIDQFDVFHVGREIRRHAHYQPAGTNANFVLVVDDHTLRVRTYERGVEDETLACGTGSVASALLAACKGFVQSPVAVHVKSGEILTIYFKKTNDGFTDVYLEGKVAVVYQGKLWDEAWRKGE
ncbi:MAG: diaminopimelate epimerase [Syntrophobacterales bacterium]|nr:diaminopimelate epimerase [Syntrophobacterales bacterium]